MGRMSTTGEPARPTTPVVPLSRPPAGPVFNPSAAIEQRVSALEPVVALNTQQIVTLDQRQREGEREHGVFRHAAASDLDRINTRQDAQDRVVVSLDQRLSAVERGVADLLVIGRHMKNWYALGAAVSIVAGALVAWAMQPKAARADEPPAALSSERR